MEHKASGGPAPGCPSWCSRRHEAGSHIHLAMVGQVCPRQDSAENVNVQAAQSKHMLDGAPFVVVTRYAAGDDDPPWLPLPPDQAAALADLLDTLQQHELAGYVRQAIGIITAATPGQAEA